MIFRVGGWLANGIVTCHAGTLAVGQVRTFHYTVVARHDLDPGTSIENCATAGSAHTRLRPRGRRSCTVAKVASEPFVPVTG